MRCLAEMLYAIDELIRVLTMLSNSVKCWDPSLMMALWHTIV